MDVDLSISNAQTWQDMKSQREKGVVYTNTTGRPIIINVGIYPAAGGVGQHIYHGYDNALADDYAFNGDSAAPSYGGSKAVTILPNEQYKYVADSGTIYTWLELR